MYTSLIAPKSTRDDSRDLHYKFPSNTNINPHSGYVFNRKVTHFPFISSSFSIFTHFTYLYNLKVIVGSYKQCEL